MLIAFEGIDGSGKSTHARLLHDYLTKKGFDAVVLKEPTKGKWGEKIREMAKYGRGEVSLKEELDYFINDRKEDVKNNIEPCLKVKKIVIMDRYYISTMAYQGAIGGDPEEILRINEGFAPPPDIIFLLDIDPEIAISRIIQGRDTTNPRFEREDYLRGVREIFNSLTLPNLKRIDTRMNIKVISEEIISQVDDLLKRYEERGSQR